MYSCKVKRLFFLFSHYHKRKKPRYAGSTLPSSYTCWSTQRGDPKETFCKEALQVKGFLSTIRIYLVWSKPKPVFTCTSLATLERAWYKPIQTGMVAKVGKQPNMKITRIRIYQHDWRRKKRAYKKAQLVEKVPANGFTPACLYKRDVSSCILSLDIEKQNKQSDPIIPSNSFF